MNRHRAVQARRKRESEHRPMRLVGADHPALHTPAQPVETFDVRLRRLAMSLCATAVVNHGQAVAAPQVGRSVRVVALPTLVVVNPRIIEIGGKLESGIERCLSLPGRRFEVDRWTRIVVAGFNLDQEEHAVEMLDAEARLWQHEIDHLDGRLVTSRGVEVATLPAAQTTRT